MTLGHSESILATYLAGSSLGMLRGLLVSLALPFTHVTMSVVIGLFPLANLNVFVGLQQEPGVSAGHVSAGDRRSNPGSCQFDHGHHEGAVPRVRNRGCRYLRPVQLTAALNFYYLEAFLIAVVVYMVIAYIVTFAADRMERALRLWA